MGAVLDIAVGAGTVDAAGVAAGVELVEVFVFDAGIPDGETTFDEVGDGEIGGALDRVAPNRLRAA